MKTKPKRPKQSPQKPQHSGEHDQKNVVSTSSVIPLSSSQAQNAPTPEPDVKPRIFSLGIGIKRADEDGENRPAKRYAKVRRAGKGDLRRL